MLANLPETDEKFSICNYEEFIMTQHPKGKEETDVQKSEREEKCTDLRAKFAATGGPGSKFRN